jgi:glycosyltransferase involved in cell wall biosynthesis
LSNVSELLSSLPTRRSIRAIVPCPDPLTGGVQADLQIIEQLRTRGWQIQVEYMEVRAGKTPRDRWRDQLEFNVRLIRRFWGAPPGFIVLEDQGLSGAVALFNLYARTVKRARIVVLTYHLVFNLWRNPVRRSIRRVIEGMVARSADLVLASSESTVGELKDLGVAERNIRPIRLGLNRSTRQVRRVERRGENVPPRLLTIGTVEPRKGLKYLIEALGQLRAHPWTLDVVGSMQNDHHAELVELACSLDLDRRIRFHGRVDDDDVVDLLNGADIYVSPSLGEGFGLAVLEAMEAGLPIVTSRAGALPELIAHEQTGLLVPPADTSALAAALLRLLLDPQLRQDLGRAAALAVEGRYTWGETGQQVDAALSAL